MIKSIIFLCSLCIILFVPGCSKENPTCPHHQKVEPVNECQRAVKDELCIKCGEIKGSDKCCKLEGRTKCPKCGLFKGSPGCCKLKK